MVPVAVGMIPQKISIIAEMIRLPGQQVTRVQDVFLMKDGKLTIRNPKLPTKLLRAKIFI